MIEARGDFIVSFGKKAMRGICTDTPCSLHASALTCLDKSASGINKIVNNKHVLAFDIAKYPQAPYFTRTRPDFISDNNIVNPKAICKILRPLCAASIRAHYHHVI